MVPWLWRCPWVGGGACYVPLLRAARDILIGLVAGGSTLKVAVPESFFAETTRRLQSSSAED